MTVDNAEVDQAQVSVLGRAFALLSSFREGETQLSFAELSRRTGIPRPTVHRMVQEMVSWDFMERSAQGVRLGIRLFELGELVPRQRDLRSTAQPILTDLAGATRQSVHLAVRDHTEVLYLSKLEGPNGPELPSRVGGRMPLYCTAVGKAQLAFAPVELIKQVLTQRLVPRTPRTIIDPRSLLLELNRVRETGVAFEYEESTPGIICVASPVFDGTGKVAAAISVSGWRNLVNVDRVDPAVQTAARTLSRALGWPAPAPYLGRPTDNA